MRSPITVVLDPGHGGELPADGSRANNAVGPNGLLEKDLNLAVAQAAVRTLGSSRYRVILTRQDDANLTLVERAALAKTAGADVFVSIHFNGHPDDSVSGAEAYVSEGARDKDRDLAANILAVVGPTSGAASRGVKTASFSVLSGEHHLPKTAICLVEMAFLTNPAQARRLATNVYVQQLGLALAQGIMAHSARLAAVQSVAGETAPVEGERVIYEDSRTHEDPPNVPINLPEPGGGEDLHDFSIPDGLSFSRWQVEVQAMSPGASYRVPSAPGKGSQGRQNVTVAWSHLPYGRISYTLRAYASPDGQADPARLVAEAPGWVENARDLVDQGVPVDLVVSGPKAKVLYSLLQKEQKKRESQITSRGFPTGVEETVAIALIGLAIVAVISAVIIAGMITLGVILKTALDKGYDVKDTKYVVKTGQGKTRQEHELAFNLTRPKDRDNRRGAS